jgi:cell wall-associated NlpC family hydrolase
MTQLRLTMLVLVFFLTVSVVPASVFAARAKAHRAERTAKLHRHVTAHRVVVGSQVVRYARQLLRVPYRYGGSSPSTGFDCSGFVRYVYQRFGIALPHSSYADYGLGRPVSRGSLRPGDLVFFHQRGHVGLYIGNGRFIHAPHTGLSVQVDSMTGWYAGGFDGARRVLAPVVRRMPKPPSLAPLAHWLARTSRT